MVKLNIIAFLERKHLVFDVFDMYGEYGFGQSILQSSFQGQAYLMLQTQRIL